MKKAEADPGFCRRRTDPSAGGGGAGHGANMQFC